MVASYPASDFSLLHETKEFAMTIEGGGRLLGQFKRMTNSESRRLRPLHFVLSRNGFIVLAIQGIASGGQAFAMTIYARPGEGKVWVSRYSFTNVIIT